MEPPAILTTPTSFPALTYAQDDLVYHSMRVKLRTCKEAYQIFLEFLKNFEESKKAVHALADNRTFKMLHCPFAIKHLLIFYVEERLEVLKQHSLLSDEIERDWVAIKLLLAEDLVHEPKDLSLILNNFSDFVSLSLVKTGSNTQEFRSTLLIFEQLFRLPIVSSTPLICFFAESLQSRDAVENERKFNQKWNDESTPERLIYVDFPPSALMQALKIMLYRFKFDIIWLEKVCTDHYKSNWPTVKKFCQSYKSHSHQDQQIITCLKNTLERMSSFFQELKELSQPFDNPNHFLENAPSRKETLETLDTFLQKNRFDEIMVTSEITGITREVNNSLLKHNKTATAVNHYTNYLFQTIYTYSYDLDAAIDATRESFQHFDPNSSYVTAQLPIDALFKVDHTAKIVLAPKPPQKSKNAQRKERKQALKAIVFSDTEKPADAIQPVKPAPKKKVPATLSQISNAILHYARGCKGSKDQKEALIQSHWHFAKCAQLQAIVTSGKIPPSDYLNLFSSYVFSAAVAIEQLYRYQLLAHDLPQNDHDFHNLLEMHLVAYGKKPIPEAVQTLKLAIDWSRRFFHMHDHILNYSTFHDNKMPFVLETLHLLALNAADVSPEDFRKFMTQIHREVLISIPKIAPFIKTPEQTPPSLEQSIENMPTIEMPSLATHIEQMKALSQHNTFSWNQAIASLQMLESSKTRLFQAKTYEEFSLWATRCLFLVEEATDFTLRALDIHKNGSTITNHNIADLAERTGITFNLLDSALTRMSMKLKYPVSVSEKGLGCELVDQIEALSHYPELDQGATIAKSALIPEWRLPLENVSMENILTTLSILMNELSSTIETQILPQFR